MQGRANSARGEEDTGLKAALTGLQPYTRSALNKFASAVEIQIDDKTAQGGSLWVRTDTANSDVNHVLAHWGFRHKSGKGWWK
jgi:hypothetical protein